MDCMAGVRTVKAAGVARTPMPCGQSRPLSSRRLEKMRANLRLRGLVAEVLAYLLDTQGAFACSVAPWFEFSCSQ